MSWLKLKPGQQYGLQKAKNTKTLLKPLGIFGEEDLSGETANAQLQRQQVSTGRAKKHALQRAAALAEDASVYDYDGVYDDLQGTREELMQERQAKKIERKSRYISTLLDKANSREVEQGIIEERRLLKERESTDHIYGDKEKFVTAAYKEKLMKDKRWLENEAKREALETDVRNKDISSFYSNVLLGGLHGGLSRSRGGQDEAEEQRKEQEKALLRATREAAQRQVQSGSSGQLVEDASDDKHEEAPHVKRAKANMVSPTASPKRPNEEVPDRVSSAVPAPPATSAPDFARRNTDAAISAARERYLTRKAAAAR